MTASLPAPSACPRQPELVARIERAFGFSVGGEVSCRMVGRDGMAHVMQKAGWSKNETDGVVGFHLGTDIFIRNDASWSVLHELIHRFGVNADRLNRWVAEGLTEAIARELKRSDVEHRATYPGETAWVQSRLLPRLKMSAVEVGRILARASDPPATLADLLVKNDPKLDRAKLVRELAPQRPTAPGLGSALCRSCSTGKPPEFSQLQRGLQASSILMGLGGVLVVTGAWLAFDSPPRSNPSGG